MDETPEDSEPSVDAAPQMAGPSGEADAETETPTEADSVQSEARWKKRALWAGGIAAGIGAAVLVYLKVKADPEDHDSFDERDDDDLWADDLDDLDEDDDEDEDEEDDDDWIVDEDLRDYLDQQEEIVGRLITEVETLDEDEWQSLYDQLDVDHQIQASDDLAEWADDAVGHPSWRSGD
jgi:hypothetical protein